MNFNDQLDRYLGPVKDRIRAMFARGVIKNVNDAARVQTLDVGLLANEGRAAVERCQNYSFTSHPLAGMEAFVCFIGGERGNPVIVGVGDRQFRITGGKPGEVFIYTDEGDTITLKRGRNIEVNTETLTMNAKNIIMNADHFAVNAGAGVDIDTPQTSMSGNTTVGNNITGGGEITDGKGRMNGMRGTFNRHTHKENGPGANTEVPNQLME